MQMIPIRMLQEERSATSNESPIYINTQEKKIAEKQWIYEEAIVVLIYIPIK